MIAIVAWAWPIMRLIPLGKIAALLQVLYIHKHANELQTLFHFILEQESNGCCIFSSVTNEERERLHFRIIIRATRMAAELF